MPNQYKNKVVYFGDTLIDLSGDTLDASKVLSGYTGHDATGAPFTGSIATKTSSDMTASGATVTAPAGYYSSAASKTIPDADYFNGNEYEFFTDGDDYKWRLRSFSEVDSDEGDTPGYIADKTRHNGEWVEFNAIPANTSVTPTESSQTIGGARTMMAGAVTVNAIPSNYVGSGITQRSSSDLTASGATVTVPSGYYSSQVTKSVTNGTAGTPTATKGTVSNHAVSVTPSVTNTTGYITGGTKTGTAVSVSAGELVSGTYTVDSSGTKDVTNYASASVPAGTAGTPSAAKGTVSNHSVTVTPSVTNQTGFITGSTINGTGVSVSASELVSGSQTITENGTVDVTNLAEVVVNVAGSGETSEWAVIVSENLHNTSDDVADTYINGSTETAYNGWASSDYIPVKPGKLYLIRSLTSNTDVAGNVYNAFYKQDKSVSVGSFYIPQTRPVTNQTSYSIIKAPSDAYYLRMSQATAKMSITAVYELSNTIFWDYALELGGINSSGDEFGAGDGTYMRTTDYLNTDVAQYMDFVSKGDATGKALFVCYYNANKEFVTRVQTTTGYQIDTSYPYIRLSFYMSSGNNESTYRSWIVWNPPVGPKTITENGIYNAGDDGYYAYSSVTVNVAGGGGSGVQMDRVGVEVETPSSSITFTGLKGEPTSFVLIPDDNSLSTASPPNVIVLVFDGTTIHGQTASTTSNANASYDTGFTKSYSNGTLTITATTARFGAEWWDCEYTYGGSSANIDTKDMQVGSGATSITFTGLDDEPIYWSCIFKSNFGTSSGYQRVMFTRKYQEVVWGYCLDSSVHGSSSYWTSSYNNGSLTITSQGTNQGGYFHQPGYYQLTYVTGGDSGGGGSANYQTKTVSPTTSQQVITADTGYDALSQVTVNAMPTGSVTAPSSISGTQATVSTGTNTLTLTKQVSVTPNVTTAGYVSSGTAGNASVSLQANVTTKGAATITPGTSNQTIASGTYLTGTQTISGDANLVAGNIKNGTSIFGVTGSYTGGSTDVATGTLNVASNVNTSTSTTIATTSTIGFTPTKFFFYKTERTATNNHVHQATFTTLGSNYIRTMTRYSSNTLSTSGNTNNWTTQTAGYLYFNSNTVYFRSSSSYILSAGTWNWVAVK